MKLFLTIVITALVIMGVLALLDWLLERGKPNDQTGSQSRRSFVRLIVSLIGGALIGSYIWHRSKPAKEEIKEELQLLFELELLLAQLEGLVNAAIAQGDTTKLLPSIQQLVEKLGKYGDRTRRFLDEVEERLALDESIELRRCAIEIVEGLDRLETAITRNERTNEIGAFLMTMQKGIHQARTKTRELIDERISKL